ncbi:hypothetical protein FBQ96_05125 [Nitrospirales bacterium NOB]|nr:hypothetical protein [Nitrospirota bacterium]MDL1888953.1 hypothetical protein [Nitrospirales bacterium NOB]
MAKKKPGRFLHIEFPSEGISSSADIAFRLSMLHATALELNAHNRVKVSYTGMPRTSEEKDPQKDNGLRLVK